MYAELILDRLLSDGPPLKEPLPYEEIEAPGSEDPEYREKWIYLYSSLLDRTVNRLFKILRKGELLRDKIVYIFSLRNMCIYN